MLYVGVLEKVDGEGMQNLMTNPSDFLVLLVITATKMLQRSPDVNLTLWVSLQFLRNLWQFLQTS